MNLILIGGLVNSAVYLLGVMAAGLAVGSHLVVVLGIASAGLAFLCYGAQAHRQNSPIHSGPSLWLMCGFHLASNGAGIAAGIVLLKVYWG